MRRGFTLILILTYFGALYGKSAPIYRVDGMMRGAAVSSGAHRLVYTYSPRSRRIGRLVSSAGLVVQLILGLSCVRWPVSPILIGSL
jgi:hypothetical protein